MISTILFCLFLIQGMIHLQGIIVATNKLQTEQWNVHSVFVDKYITGANKKAICFVLYFIATAIFFGAAFSVESIFTSTDIWVNLIMIALAVSYVGIELFPNAIAVYVNNYLALAINVIIAVIYFYTYAGLAQYP